MKTRLALLVLFNCLIFCGSCSQPDIITELKAKAEKGDAKSQCALALCYYKGEGVTKDLSEAVKWVRKAAEQGYAEAQEYLGASYHYGYGVTEDQAEAAKWVRKAAEQGGARAQSVLGTCYEEGIGVVKDLAQAHTWFNLASVGGHEGSKTKLKEIEAAMTPDQIAEATKLAREMEAKIKSARDKK